MLPRLLLPGVNLMSLLGYSTDLPPISLLGYSTDLPPPPPTHSEEGVLPFKGVEHLFFFQGIICVNCRLLFRFYEPEMTTTSDVAVPHRDLRLLLKRNVQNCYYK